ncbi:MAG: ABC transporter permease [Eubacteriales bacterium]|nr:ABC transporter permease [Eubacteriales bacterium]
MEEKWTTVIKPKAGWFEINWRELSQYRDLIFLFVRRDFSVQYKQTVLGPLWFILKPLMTTFMFTMVFGQIAGMETDGVPQFAFYLCSTALWQYFASCVTKTSHTFLHNAGIFGKVYFPRLIMPIAAVLYALVNFAVVFAMSIIINLYYWMRGGMIRPQMQLLWVPLLVLQTAALGLGVGIIVSSLTTKYRDLNVLVSFGVQLWMYGTPVVYASSQIPERLRVLIMLNPMAPILCNFRYALLGSGGFETFYWGISMITTIVLLGFGILLFNRVEKTFMDTV